MHSHLQFLTIKFDTSKLGLPVESHWTKAFCLFWNRGKLHYRVSQFQPPSGKPKLELLIGEFGRFYYQLSKFLLGTHLDRKRKQAPLTYAFIDFEGTRSNRPVQDIIKGKLPHVHAVMLVPPKLMTPTPTVEIPHPRSFHWAIRDPTVFWLPSIRDPRTDFRVEQFNPAKSSLENLISYCMKGYLQVPQSYAGREDLWALFPK